MKDLGKVPNKYITLAKPEEQEDQQGGRKPGFAPVASVWAEMRIPNLTQTNDTGGIVSKATQEFRIWRRTDVRRDWQVTLGDRKFSVLHTYEPNGEKIALICQEIVR